MRIIGIDPGLNKCGWGVVDSNGSNIKHVANGIIKTNSKLSFSDRLLNIDTQLTKILNLWKPELGAIEETFVNKSPASSLKLGAARGAAIVCMARYGLNVDEYGANLVKKAIVGAGHADKNQMMMMVKTLLPGVLLEGEDAADALAVAICHANHASTNIKIAGNV